MHAGTDYPTLFAKLGFHRPDFGEKLRMSAPETLPNDRTPGRRLSASTRKSKVKIVSLILAILLAVTGILVVAIPGPTQPTQDVVTQPAPAASESLAPAPAVTYYQQSGPPAGSPLEKVDPLTVKVSNREAGTALGQGMAGISLEATDLGDPALSSANASLVKLLAEVDEPILRFGGNAVDRRFFWTSSGEAIPASYKGDKAHPARAVGPEDLTRVNTLLDATKAKVSLTVDLGHFNPARAADMVKNASSIFGDRLLSITVGNEPNGYGYNGVRPGGYTPENYVAELKEYAKAIFAVAPEVVISGPGTYSEKWWKPFIDADIPQKKILSFHNYPLYSCDGTDPQGSPTLKNLMSPLMHQRAADYQQAALKAGQAAGLETWLPETGIAACPGANETSRTHASALWTADYLLNAARLGITRMGFHSSLLTCQGGPPMSLICSGGAYLQPDGRYEARANFYGLAMVAELEGGKFLESESAGGGLSYSYALSNPDGSTTVIVVNQNDPQKAAQTDVTLTLPGRARTGTMTQLSGPSYDAEGLTVIDGAKAGPKPVNERPTVPGFEYGSPTQSFSLTAGTVTVLNFTY